MRIFDKEHKLIKIVCNQCGQSEDVAGGLLKKDFFCAKKEWGYFSCKDMEQHRFDLCEQCYDRLVGGFKVPVEAERKSEVL